MESSRTDCELCLSAEGPSLWRDELLRIVAVEDAGYAGFCRVIVNRHIAEMSDLSAPERRRVMDAVFLVETCLRELMRPDKINLASLGNVVPHVHWHVIPRYRDDAHFPAPIWGMPVRDTAKRPQPDWQSMSARLARLGAES